MRTISVSPFSAALSNLSPVVTTTARIVSCNHNTKFSTDLYRKYKKPTKHAVSWNLPLALKKSATISSLAATSLADFPSYRERDKIICVLLKSSSTNSHHISHKYLCMRV